MERGRSPSAGVVALPPVGWLGFELEAHGAPEALLGLKLLFALGSVLAHTGSVQLIARFSGDQHRHGAIQAALHARNGPFSPIPLAAE